MKSSTGIITTDDISSRSSSSSSSGSSHVSVTIRQIEEMPPQLDQVSSQGEQPPDNKEMDGERDDGLTTITTTHTASATSVDDHKTDTGTLTMDSHCFKCPDGEHRSRQSPGGRRVKKDSSSFLGPLQCGDHFMMNGDNYDDDDDDDVVVLQQGQDETEKEQSVPPIAVRSNFSEEETAVLSAAEAILPSPAVPEMKGSSSFLGSLQCGGNHFMMDDDGDEDNGEVVLQQGQDETGKEQAVPPITVTSNGCVSEEETPAVLAAAEEILDPLQCRNHFMMDDDDLVEVLQQGQDEAGKEQVVPPIAVTS
ncbi:hypothetical protein ACA910_008794 [Epithemia clementina (nom. ined.)]